IVGLRCGRGPHMGSPYVLIKTAARSPHTVPALWDRWRRRKRHIYADIRCAGELREIPGRGQGLPHTCPARFPREHQLGQGNSTGFVHECAAFETGDHRRGRKPALLQPNRRSEPSSAKEAEHVEITKPPELEIAHDDLAIIRWTSTNPWGDDAH